MKYLNETGLAHLWEKIEELAGDEVYIGTAAPTANSKYTIWINPSGTPSSLVTLAQVQALGYQTSDQVQSAISTALGEVENGTY